MDFTAEGAEDAEKRARSDRSVRIYSIWKAGYVSLEAVHVEEHSVEFAVSIKQPGPFGIPEGWQAAGFVWCERSDLDKFVEQLHACERTRSGSATLRSMSPGALELIIEGRTASGKLGLRYRLQEHLYDGDGASLYPLTIAGGFDLDSEFIPSLVKEMGDWIADLAAEPPA